MSSTLLAAALAIGADPTPPLPGFRPAPWIGERVREEWVADGVRAVALAPGVIDPGKPTRLIVYATPNGNTIEQTIGCGPTAGLDWHFDIQHVAAQVRRYRETTPGENVVLACVEADGLSWPAWRRKHADAPALVRKVVDALRDWVGGDGVRVALAGHSGGGSFLFAFLDSGDALPAWVDRVAFLDANYSYSDADRHGDKLRAWLDGDHVRRLTVIAYDDREVMLNGKRVVGPTGGTFRATERMRERFTKDVTFAESTAAHVVTRTARDGRLALLVHTNPENRILHTALVGEMNGLLHALDGRAAFGAPRAYTKWVQPAPALPPRPADAVGGTEFVRGLEKLTPAAREAAIAKELLRGNLPDFLRTFAKVTMTAPDAAGKPHSATIEVMPDYLAVGSDADFVRVPMTPRTAALVADAFGCALPTRRVVDEVYRAAALRLTPDPLTEARESPLSFLRHHALVEARRASRAGLIAGIKKDVVVTNRLTEKAGRVAIYGWHTPDGKPIQPLSLVHHEGYVDYSHGVRLMRRTVVVDGTPRDVRHVLYGADTHRLLSDEGPITRPTY